MKKVCEMKWKTAEEFVYLSERVSASGGYEAAVIVGTRFVWITIRECDEVLYEVRFPVRPEGTVYRKYSRATILYLSEKWQMRENEVGILSAWISMVVDMCGVQFKYRK